MESKTSIFNDWGNEISAGRNNIVFETRNKEYGAYYLRMYYGKRAINALLMALSIFIILLAIPYISKLLDEKNKLKETHRSKDIVTELGPPPPMEKELPPPPKLNIPKQIEQVRFVPPKVVIKPVEEPELPKNTDPPKPTAPDTKPGPDTSVYVPPSNPIPPPKKQEPYTYVEQMPTFPGGEEKLFEFLSNNLKYPPFARENNIIGTVFLTFVVSEEGRISEVQVLRGIAGGAVCDAEAKRVVESMPPWKPGKQNGRAVPVRYNLPIKFKLN